MCDKQNYKYNGSITLILGPMFSGKTSYLINEYKRYIIGGKKCLMIKNNKDNRYDNNFIKTHDAKYDYDNNYKKLDNGVIITKMQDGIECHTYNCDLLMKADKIVNNYDNIFIDEIQFFEDCVIFCDKWANQGKKIFCSGLSGTFERKPFDNISKLIPISENIYIKSAVCKTTGQDASFSKREIEDDNIVIIGNDNIYSATDRNTYFNNLSYDEYYNYEKNNLINYINIYNKNFNTNYYINETNFNKFIKNNFGLKKITDYNDLINNNIIVNDIDFLNYYKNNKQFFIDLFNLSIYQLKDYLLNQIIFYFNNKDKNKNIHFKDINNINNDNKDDKKYVNKDINNKDDNKDVDVNIDDIITYFKKNIFEYIDNFKNLNKEECNYKKIIIQNIFELIKLDIKNKYNNEKSNNLSQSDNSLNLSNDLNDSDILNKSENHKNINNLDKLNDLNDLNDLKEINNLNLDNYEDLNKSIINNK